MNRRYIIAACVLIVALGSGIFYFLQERKSERGVYLAPLSRENIDRAIDRGLFFIEEQQRPDGSFLLYVCDVTEPERCDPIQSAVHTAGVIAALLPFRDDPRVRAMVEKAKPFIFENMDTTPDGRHAVWNLFGKKDERYDRIPADIDSTALVSITLKKYSIAFPDDVSALEQYKNEGGLFYNWISDSWNLNEKSRHSFGGGKESDFSDKNYFGVDCVVNTDVLTYLSYVGKESPEICAYVNNVVETQTYPQCTFYYRNPYLFAFVVAVGNKDNNVTCTAPSMQKLQNYVVTQERGDGTWSSNVFSNVSAIGTLLKTGYRGELVDRGVQRVLEQQATDGGWAKANLFPDLYNPVFYGSKAISTAVILNVLAMYQENEQKPR